VYTYDFTFENIKALINSPVVADDGEPYELEIDDSEVLIRKPYVDDDGDALGNSIRIESPNGAVVYISIQTSGDQELAAVLFKAKQADAFTALTNTAPESIKSYADEMWTQTVDAMNTAEMQLAIDIDDSVEEFAEQFGEQAGGRRPPEVLERLLALEARYGRGRFSDGFSLNTYDKTGMSSWSSHPDFLRVFVDFASANGSGSTYAFWVIEEELARCPIVVFGDEGGIHIVADSVGQLLQLMTFDTEITVNFDQAYFYREDDDDDYEASEKRNVFLAFVESETGAAPITSMEQCDAVIAAAQYRYKGRLDEFVAQYINS
jgi:hypothetical protein